jgi:Kef-type K+ transport system membrane component KefB
VFGGTIANNLALVCAIVATPILAKWIAGVATQKCLGYSRDEGLIMWALALPQVAATLAVALTAYKAKDQAGNGLIDEPVLNSVLVLVVVTSVIGPILTEVFGERMAVERKKAASVAGMDAKGIGPEVAAATTLPTPS